MSGIVYWRGVTKHDLPPDRILEQAVGNLESVIVLGFDKNGEEYLAASMADGGDALWLMERCKMRLLEVATVKMLEGE